MKEDPALFDAPVSSISPHSRSITKEEVLLIRMIVLYGPLQSLTVRVAYQHRADTS